MKYDFSKISYPYIVVKQYGLEISKTMNGVIGIEGRHALRSKLVPDNKITEHVHTLNFQSSYISCYGEVDVSYKTENVTQ
jgi:hypothetical protein